MRKRQFPIIAATMIAVALLNSAAAMADGDFDREGFFVEEPVTTDPIRVCPVGYLPYPQDRMCGKPFSGRDKQPLTMAEYVQARCPGASFEGYTVAFDWASDESNVIIRFRVPDPGCPPKE